MASGFALRRNGSCLATETECGGTVSPYHACCPSGSFCPHQYNVNCCPTAANCTQALLPDPQCANAEWDLFDNNGYFCCLRGLAGYATPGNTDGCAGAGYKFQEGEQLLKTISTGNAISTITSLRSSRGSSSPDLFVTTISEIPSSPTFIASITPKTNRAVGESVTAISPETSTSPASTASTAPKTGAIIGGSVGAVIAVALLALTAWFLLVRQKKRRRRREQPEDDHHELPGDAEADDASAHPGAGAIIIHEKDSRNHIIELPVNIIHEKDSRSISEMPAVGLP